MSDKTPANPPPADPKAEKKELAALVADLKADDERRTLWSIVDREVLGLARRILTLRRAAK